MTSYLRSWLSTGTSALEYISSSAPSVQKVSPPPSEDGDGDDTETERDDDDSPPAFPSLNSAQRVGSSKSSIPTILTDSQLMPPPPVPSLAVRQPGVSNARSSNANSNSNSLAVPPTTTKIPPKPKKSAKVALAPGHSPLDWAALKASGTDLRVCFPLISDLPR